MSIPDEKALRLELLKQLLQSYHHYQGNAVMQNNIIREMIPHCNRIFLSVGEFLLNQAAPQPFEPIVQPAQISSPAAGSRSELPSASPPIASLLQCPECERKFESLQQLHGHISGHRRADRKLQLKS